MRKLLFAILVFLATFFIAQNVQAANLDINCFGTGTCTKTGQDPLFSKALDGYWMPGDSVSKTFKIINSAGDTREVFMKPVRTSSAGIIENVMDITLFPSGGGTPNWSGTLNNFYNLGDFSLGNIASGGNVEYKITARMKPEANNDYQGKSTVFDLNFSFWVESTTTTTTSTSGGGDGGGTGGGTTPCTDTKPGTPINFSVVAGPNPDQATLSWIGVSPYTSFLVAYSDNNLSPKWGNPNVGSGFSYTVSGLGSGTYYFWVRAQNGCMPGDFAGPVFISTGTVGGAFSELPGFSEDTLGISTPSAEAVEGINGETKGVGVCDQCIWWQILLLELIALLVVGRIITRKRIIILSLIALLSYLVFLWINRHCQSNLIFCQIFWLLDILVYIFYLILPGFGVFKPKSD